MSNIVLGIAKKKKIKILHYNRKQKNIVKCFDLQNGIMKTCALFMNVISQIKKLVKQFSILRQSLGKVYFALSLFIHVSLKVLKSSLNYFYCYIL